MMDTIPYPVVSANGAATHVLVPITVYLSVFERKAPTGHTFVPIDVSEAVLEGDSPMKAWRNHRRMTQDKVALLMSVSRSAYAQMEKTGNTPHRATLEKAAKALGVACGQLADLYDDEELPVPCGMADETV